jgi:hypothetical protein
MVVRPRKRMMMMTVRRRMRKKLKMVVVEPGELSLKVVDDPFLRAHLNLNHQNPVLISFFLDISLIIRGEEEESVKRKEGKKRKKCKGTSV